MKFWRRLLGQGAAERPSALKGRRVFAVGDIHGCDDLLEGLIAAMTLASKDDRQPPVFVFLGDYLDRGPGSRRVIEMLIAFRDAGYSARFLCGNHEEAMLRFMADTASGLAWPEYGGKATLASYGVCPPADETSLPGWQKVAAELKAAMPETHLRFLYSLENSIELGDYMFVHAGVRPGYPLDRQTVRDLRWIREPFLSDAGPLDRIIVHGHTPSRTPYADARRIGIDTWAYHSGVLTAVELYSERHPRFLQAQRVEGGVSVDWVSPGPMRFSRQANPIWRRPGGWLPSSTAWLTFP